MQGKILRFDAQSGAGTIRGQDDRRYEFHDAQWLDRTVKPGIGLAVDFSAENDTATEILPLGAANPAHPEQLAAFSASSNGTLFGILSVVAAVIGFLPGFGVIFLCVGVVLGMQARRQGKATGNQTAVFLGTIGLGVAAVVVFVNVVALLGLSALLLGFGSGVLK